MKTLHWTLKYTFTFLMADSISSLSLRHGTVLDLQRQHPDRGPEETMLSIAESCVSLGIDTFDVYGDFDENRDKSFLRKFEAQIAQDFGKEDAVFMLSGTMAQNIALLVHSRKEEIAKNKNTIDAYPLRFACHQSCHLLLWEEESYEKLLGFGNVKISTDYQRLKDSVSIPPLMFNDVQHAFLNEKGKYPGKSLGESGLSTLIIELPHRELGGKITPWGDVLSIGKLCGEEGVKYHCDGARIFEASAGYGMEVAELADPFDSVYISFYKGLGSISGAMLIGTTDFCDEARTWMGRFGGNLYSKLPYIASCWINYNTKLNSETPLSFADKFQKLRKIVSKLTEEKHVNQLVAFEPAVPETNMIHVYLKAPFDKCEKARDMFMERTGIKVFSRLRPIPPTDGRFDMGYEAYLEWTIGDANGSIADELIVKSWCDYAKLLSDSL